MDEGFSLARIASTELEERLQNEQRTSQSRLEELHSKENVIRMHQRRLEEEQQQKEVLEERLRSLQEALDESRDWIIQREEVVLSENILGRWSWGFAREGTFRGCQIAVKEIHELILSDHNRRLFEREMSIASRCRHLNLLQFIGATNDNGSPLFVT